MTDIKPFTVDMWTDALRSGEYKQGVSKLVNTNSDSFCCLGVLCDLAVKAGVDLEVTDHNGHNGTDDSFESYRTYDGAIGVLPEKVIRWATMVNENPEIPTGKHTFMSLAEFNDSGQTFESVASLIENNKDFIFIYD